MREVTTKVYLYEELSDEAKEKAKEWYRNDLSMDFEWANDNIRESAICDLEHKYHIEANKNEMYWNTDRGSYFAFTGIVNDVEEFVTEALSNFSKNNESLQRKFDRFIRWTGYDLSINIKFGYGSTSSQIDGEIPYGYHDRIDEMLEAVYEVCQEYLDDICFDLRKMAESEYDYVYSDEYVENQVAQYEFTEEGKRF